MSTFLWLKQCVEFTDILIVFIRLSVWLLWVCDRFMTLHLELSRLGWAPANKCGATGVKPLFIATQASWNSCSVQLHESAQMRSERIQKYFYRTHACRHATKIICTQGGWATIKWNQDGGARAGKIQAFSTPPPLSKDTDGICLIRDTISF